MNFTRQGVILFTKNYDACVKFYTEILELPVTHRKNEPGSILTCCDFGGAYLMIEDGGTLATAKKSLSQNPTKLRFNVDDVEASARALRAKGVDLTVETFPWGTIANFTDPDGNLCSLRDEKSFG